MYTGENLPMRAKESRNRNFLMRLSEQSLELVTGFKEARRDLIYIFIFHKADLCADLKDICACPEIIDLI